MTGGDEETPDGLEETFAELSDIDGHEPGIYTTLAPLYHAMYVARGRIEGQLATVRRCAPAGTGTVLEVGCGTGALLGALDEEYDQAVGADPALEMCRLAAGHAPVVRAATGAFVPGCFDLAVLVGAVLGHIRPDDAARRALADIHETLHPGGRVVCSVHDRRGLDAPRERSLTRTVDGYQITQTDRQRPLSGGEFDWQVTFEVTARNGETRRVRTVETLRAFAPGELAGWFESVGLDTVETRPRTYVDGSGEAERAFVIVGER